MKTSELTPHCNSRIWILCRWGEVGFLGSPGSPSTYHSHGYTPRESCPPWTQYQAAEASKELELDRRSGSQTLSPIAPRVPDLSSPSRCKRSHDPASARHCIFWLSSALIHKIMSNRSPCIRAVASLWKTVDRPALARCVRYIWHITDLFLLSCHQSSPRWTRGDNWTHSN